MAGEPTIATLGDGVVEAGLGGLAEAEIVEALASLVSDPVLEPSGPNGFHAMGSRGMVVKGTCGVARGLGAASKGCGVASSAGSSLEGQFGP